VSQLSESGLTASVSQLRSTKLSESGLTASVSQLRSTKAARAPGAAASRVRRLAVTASSNNNESRYGACWPGRVEVQSEPTPLPLHPYHLSPHQVGSVAETSRIRRGRG
jgi:hypothetical protein